MINGIITQGVDYNDLKGGKFELQQQLVDGNIIPKVIERSFKLFLQQCGDKLFSIFETQLNGYLLDKYNTSYEQLEQSQESIKENFESTFYDMAFQYMEKRHYK